MVCEIEGKWPNWMVCEIEGKWPNWMVCEIEGKWPNHHCFWVAAFTICSN